MSTARDRLRAKLEQRGGSAALSSEAALETAVDVVSSVMQVTINHLTFSAQQFSQGGGMYLPVPAAIQLLRRSTQVWDSRDALAHLVERWNRQHYISNCIATITTALETQTTPVVVTSGEEGEGQQEARRARAYAQLLGMRAVLHILLNQHTHACRDLDQLIPLLDAADIPAPAFLMQRSRSRHIMMVRSLKRDMLGTLDDDNAMFGDVEQALRLMPARGHAHLRALLHLERGQARLMADRYLADTV